jgi:hypothetical protein
LKLYVEDPHAAHDGSVMHRCHCHSWHSPSALPVVLACFLCVQKTSCGTLSASARTAWEDGLFGGIYHDSEGHERVKYGVLNIVQDPNGVMACRMYGDSFLWLKNDTVRLRTSFASRDTGGGTAKLASCEWYAHVLMEYNDAELQDVISVATGAKR